MNIRLAQFGDIDALRSLAYSSFDARYIDKMIYGCDGIERYLKMCLSQEDAISDTVIYVCEIKREVCGFVHFKRDLFNGILYLNYICVHVDFRGRSIASHLLLHSVSHESGFEKIVLDVFLRNSVALAWYEKLGFCQVKERRWLIYDIKDAGSGYGSFSSLAHTKLSQSTFGFSQLGLETRLGVYKVGLLGHLYYRTFDNKIIYDDAALSSLARLAPSRRLIVITDQPVSDSDVEFFDVSFNMFAFLQPVMERLKAMLFRNG
ncbi:GNAT family N-acetyltransferase [Stutzerimonas degradans]|nr:GNAT family N-acetyltransferase [Stutzerimonas degradans]